MSNMSHVQFENTGRDLHSCYLDLDQMFTGDGRKLSKSELSKAIDLVGTCHAILSLICDHSGMDEEEFNDKMNCDPEALIKQVMNHAQQCAKEDSDG